MKIALTIAADPDMSHKTWCRNVEELRQLVNKHVPIELWDEVKVYGPDSEGFSCIPAVCIEAELPVNAFAALLKERDASEWFDVPVHTYVMTERQPEGWT